MESKLRMLLFTAFIFAPYSSSWSVAGSPILACSNLEQAHPTLTIFPTDDAYAEINQDYFSAEEWLNPACIFTPNSADLMAYAVKEIQGLGVNFAVRGGGWMPISGSANINSTGILLSTTNLTGIALSDDHAIVSVAAGHNWADIAEVISPLGLAVVGSRIGVVGVPGFLLGGGMSFLGNEYGWASANIVAYEAILATGSIVYVNSTNEYSDLFWALRGGGNNYAIITKFELKTYDIPQVAIGQVAYGSNQREAFIENLYDFTQNGLLDERAFVLPTISFVPAAGPNITYSAMLFYNGGNNTSPPALANFLDSGMMPASSTFSVRSLSDWFIEADGGYEQIHGQNFRFHGFSILANLEAAYEVHDTFFRYTMARGPDITGFISTLAMNPISKSFIENNRGPSPAGDPMGIDANAAPYFFCEETFSWSYENDTMRIEQLIQDINTDLYARLGDNLIPFLYLNNAGNGQEVFQGYDSINIERLRGIKSKYDPSGLYTKQLVGGFKLE